MDLLQRKQSVNSPKTQKTRKMILKIPFSNITLEDITKFLSEKGEKNENNVLKVLNESM